MYTIVLGLSTVVHVRGLVGPNGSYLENAGTSRNDPLWPGAAQHRRRGYP